MKARCLVALGVLGACRFGGPSANPYEYVSFPDAATDAPYASSADDASPPPADDSSPPPPDDGGPGDDAEGGGDSDGPPDDAAGSGSCSGTVAVCDPIHNTGCNPLQQCDVDPLETSTPTGLCVFGAMEAGVCASSIVSESCPPKSTCVDGGCRQLCFCNADCPVGQCCSDTSGPPGFILCRTCP
jgi:hypothetical protein